MSELKHLYFPITTVAVRIPLFFYTALISQEMVGECKADFYEVHGIKVMSVKR